MSEIILVDLPSKGSSPHCWSLNPWKARASLNYKNLPYKTEWVEYPDLASTLSSLGVAKNDGTAAYTEYSSPAAKLPDGTWIMDSRKIAEALDKLQPQPSLHMDRADIIDKTQATVLGVQQNLAANIMPRVPVFLLNPRSAEYFHETRSKRFGMPLEEFGKSEKSGETAWKNAAPHIQKLGELLREKKGPFILGEDVSFADFVVGGLFVFLKRLDRDGDVYGRLLGMDEAFGKHFQAIEKVFERDD
jgi:glutathione S-transferase